MSTELCELPTRVTGEEYHAHAMLAMRLRGLLPQVLPASLTALEAEAIGHHEPDEPAPLDTNVSSYFPSLEASLTLRSQG